MSDATNLTGEQIAELRERAGRSPFIDPRSFRRIQDASFHREWAEAILGESYAIGRLSASQIDLLALALDAEPDRPVPVAEQARREAASQAAREAEYASREYERDRQLRVADERAAWRALRDRLPVPVTVGHNWTIGHYDGHTAGKDHIVVQADLHVGRLRRSAKQTLCETPSKAKSQRSRYGNTDPLRGVDRDDDGKDRIPTCAACLRTVNGIAARL